jgi:HK97 family phage prohead protease
MSLVGILANNGRMKFDVSPGAVRNAHRKVISADVVRQVDEGTVRIVASTDSIDRAGDIVVPSGIQLDRYRKNPVILFQHDPEKPIAKARSVGVVGNRLEATIEFPPDGVSALSDEVRRLIKAGVLNAWSIGFMPIASEPIDSREPYGAQKFTQIELMEISAVSVPANQDALTIERSYAGSMASSTPSYTAAHYCADMRTKLEREAQARSLAPSRVKYDRVGCVVREY